MRKVVYTVLTNNYCEMPTDTVPIDGWEYLCYTDNPAKQAPYPWKTISIAGLPQLKPVCLNDEFEKFYLNRNLKIKPGTLFEWGTLTVYHDARISIDENILTKLVEKYQDGQIIIQEHDYRDTISDELLFLYSNRLMQKESVKRYVSDLKHRGFNFRNFKCISGCFLIRKIDRDMLIFSEKWMEDYMYFPAKLKRDQIAFGEALQRSGFDQLKLIPREIQMIKTLGKYNKTSAIFEMPTMSDVASMQSYVTRETKVPLSAPLLYLKNF